MVLQTHEPEIMDRTVPTPNMLMDELNDQLCRVVKQPEHRVCAQVLKCHISDSRSFWCF